MPTARPLKRQDGHDDEREVQDGQDESEICEVEGSNDQARRADHSRRASHHTLRRSNKRSIADTVTSVRNVSVTAIADADAMWMMLSWRRTGPASGGAYTPLITRSVKNSPKPSTMTNS